MRLSELVLRPLCKPPSRIKSGSGNARGNKKQLAVVQIPQVKTIQEANALAVSLGLAKYADFGQLDVSVANEAIAQVSATKAIFPGLQELDFLGSEQAFNAYAGANWRMQGYDAAFTVLHNGVHAGEIGIGINERSFDPDKIQITERQPESP